MYRLNRSKDIHREEENPFDGDSSPGGNFFSKAFTKISRLSGTSTYIQSDLPIQTVKTDETLVRQISLTLDSKHKFVPRSNHKKSSCSLWPYLVILVIINIALSVSLLLELEVFENKSEAGVDVSDVGFCGTTEDDQEIRDFIASLFADVESFGNRLTIQEEDLSCMPSDALGSLSESQLDSFENVNVIDIERNCLKSISPNVFRTGNFKTELTEFTLSNNCLEEVPSDLYSRFSKIDIIRLSNNNLRELDDDLFDSIEFVDILAVNGNRFQSVPETFKSLNPRVFNIGTYGGLVEISEGYFADFDLLDILNVRGTFLVRSQFNGNADDFRAFTRLRANATLDFN